MNKELKHELNRAFNAGQNILAWRNWIAKKGYPEPLPGTKRDMYRFALQACGCTPDHIDRRLQEKPTDQDIADAINDMPAHMSDQSAKASTEGGPVVSDGVERCAMVYEQIIDANPELDTDKAVWDWIEANGERVEWPAVSREAFVKQLGRARRAGRLSPKQSPKGQHRATGKSVVRRQDID